jgi:uncharacterized protein (DUF1697 family)
MAAVAAFLRAVNVGGTGKLPMARLRVIADAAGCHAPETYLASGNLIFDDGGDPAGCHTRLETTLATEMGKHVPIFVRDHKALRGVLDALPWPDASGAQVGIVIGSDTLDPNLATGQTDERLTLAAGHLAVHFVSGMGRSKLRHPGFTSGTMRNRNTVEAICARLAAREG